MKNLIIGSDKPVPSSNLSKRSAVFSVNYSKLSTATINYHTAPPFIEAIKYEDFTVTPDGKYVIATTGFDRVHFSGSSEWDNYNTLLFWPVGKSGKVNLVSPSMRDGVTSSVQLRKKISSILITKAFPAGVPYFKIEGLAAVPGNTLLFGIRGLGTKYDNFDYSIIIVSVSYSISKDKMILSDDFKKIFDYDVSGKKADIGQSPALSSIEYDAYNHRIYLLTSYEPDDDVGAKDTDLGAFLWTISMENLMANKEPDLVLLKSSSKPLHFAHKAEGIAVISDTRVFVIHDDDRALGRPKVNDVTTQFSRKANEAAFTVVDFVK